MPTSRSRLGVAGLIITALVAGIVAFTVAGPSKGTNSTSTPPSTGSVSVSPLGAHRPNFLVILSDDQRADTLWAMPHVRHTLAARGVTFRRAFVSNPLCCPSRTTILTGLTSGHTGVWTNEPPLGGFKGFDPDRTTTMAAWLQAAGYRTGLFGKYLNGYDASSEPPGWDRWVAFARLDASMHGDRFAGGRYYDYDLDVDGKIEHHGFAAREYSTRVVGAYADRFITAGGPFFAFVTPFAPHWGAQPDPRDMEAFPDLAPYRPPSYDEADMSDKPAHFRDLPRLGLEAREEIDRFRLRQYRSLQAVDRMVRRLVHDLRESHQLRNTFIVYMGDNGIMWGEHRLRSKFAAYEESIRVPLVIRFDRLIDGARSDRHLVANFDLAPTIAHLAGVTPPTALDGRSLLPLLRGDRVSTWRQDVLLEYGAGGSNAYCGVRSSRYSFIVYGTGEEELYDLKKDPYELQSKAGSPALAPVRARLLRRLRRLCDPLPPGLTSLPRA